MSPYFCILQKRSSWFIRRNAVDVLFFAFSFTFALTATRVEQTTEFVCNASAVRRFAFATVRTLATKVALTRSTQLVCFANIRKIKKKVCMDFVSVVHFFDCFVIFVFLLLLFLFCYFILISFDII